MNAKTLIHMSGSKVPMIAECAGVFWTSVYRALQKDPVPTWLLRAIDVWYAQYGPIKPVTLDTAFRQEFKTAWNESVGVPALLRNQVTLYPTTPSGDNPVKKGKHAIRHNEETRTPGIHDAGLRSNESGSVREDSGNNGASSVSGGLRETMPAADRGMQRSDLSGPQNEDDARHSRDGGETEKQITGQDASPRASGSGVSTAAVQPGILRFRPDDPVDCAKYWLTHLTGPGTRNFKKAFIAEVINQHWCAHIAEHQRELWISRKMKAINGVGVRDKKPNALVTERDEMLIQVCYAPFVAKRKRSYSKGAYADKTKTSRRRILTELFTEEPTLKAQVQAVLDKVEFNGLKQLKNIVPHIEKIIRKIDGGSNPVAEVEKYQSKMLAPRALYPCHMVFLDGSTMKAEVENGFGTESDSGYQRRFYFLCRDVATRKVFGCAHSAQSEDYGWGGGLPTWDAGQIVTSGNALADILFQMGHAPEIASIDRKSGVATQLLHLSPDKPINVMPGVLLWLYCGVIWHIRQGGRKTGGSYIERDIRTTQDYFEGIEARMAVTKELSGMGFRKERKLDSEVEYRRAFNETLVKVNKLLVKPQSGFELPADFTGFQERGEMWSQNIHKCTRVLAPDIRETWSNQIRKVRVGLVNKRRVKFGHGKDARFFEIDGALMGMNGPLKDFNAEECISISIPSGGLAGDDKNMIRVFIIDKTKGKIPHIVCGEAHVARVDEYMQDVKRPTPGHYCALPDQQADQVAKMRDNANKFYREGIESLATQRGSKREGTTGGSIEV